MRILLTITYLSFGFCLCAQKITERAVELNGIKGTLSLPEEDREVAILLVAGSGPTDRDGNSEMGLKNNSLKMVAHELTISGYAVLRYDKRGVAASANAISNRSERRFEHLVEDAKNWLIFLHNEGFRHLIIVGHSQGSLVGMMAAKNNPYVRGFISIAGLAENAGNILVRQLEAQSPALAENARINIDSIKQGFTVEKYSPFLIPLFGPEAQPFLKSYLAYTPVEEIQKIRIPVLIINGTSDLQVEEDQAAKLKSANPEAELLIVERMSHILKDASLNRAENIKSYNNPDSPLSNGLLSGIISFLENLNL